MHIIRSLARNVTNELVAGWRIMERVKRLAGNEIELGMMISTIESRASNIQMTKGTTYVVMQFDSACAFGFFGFDSVWFIRFSVYTVSILRFIRFYTEIRFGFGCNRLVSVWFR